eukprot:maker-scaffold14_size734282-snap-gene-4.9 protein:Tk11302 transcript:maker-scaffold14_size734282-snap-gene-4.9-mRNA-1 annotation:"hypothetical protein TcasGA2_TC001128"
MLGVVELARWPAEAQSVIADIQDHVQLIAISSVLKSTNTEIFLNLTTREQSKSTVHLSAEGFRVVGRAHNSHDPASEEPVFETPYSLLSSLSPGFNQSFANQLAQKLAVIAAQTRHPLGTIRTDTMSKEPTNHHNFQKTFSRPPYTIPNRGQRLGESNENSLDLEQLELSLSALDLSDSKNFFTAEITKNSLGFGFSIKGGQRHPLGTIRTDTMSKEPTNHHNFQKTFSRPPYTIPNRGQRLGESNENSLDLEQLELSLSALDLSDSKNFFTAEITKNSLGFGFSIKGGQLSSSGNGPLPLIRIKKIFPLQPAWQTGRLRVGDILVKAGETPLGGLNLRQALDILRTCPMLTVLTLCRPFLSPEVESMIDRSMVVRSYSDTTYIHRTLPRIVPTVTENHDATSDDAHSIEEEMQEINSNYLSPKDPSNQHFIGQFVMSLAKNKGSLGFTLCKAKEGDNEFSVMRHTIKAVTKDPAMSDGRIKPGDKLIAANEQDCDDLSHEELIQFLRSCGNSVTLKLYRDASRSQTPLTPDGGPTPIRSQSFDNQSRHKELRFEAKEMVRSLQASRSSLDKVGGDPDSRHQSLSKGLRSHKYFSNHLGHFKERYRHRTTSECESIPVVESPISPVKEFPGSLPPLHLPYESYLIMEDLNDEVLDLDEIQSTPEVEFPRVPTYESDMVEYVSESEIMIIQDSPERSTNNNLPPASSSRLKRPSQLNLNSTAKPFTVSYSFTYQEGPPRSQQPE